VRKRILAFEPSHRSQFENYWTVTVTKVLRIANPRSDVSGRVRLGREKSDMPWANTVSTSVGMPGW